MTLAHISALRNYFGSDTARLRLWLITSERRVCILQRGGSAFPPRQLRTSDAAIDAVAPRADPTAASEFAMLASI